MKQTVKLVASLFLLIILCSCNHINIQHPNIGPRYLPANSIPQLNVSHAVAIKNISTSNEETRLCGFIKIEWWGNLYKITEATTEIAKDALQRNHIIIDDKAEKTLALSVDKFTCEHGWKITYTTTLKVETGNGLIKEYTGLRKNPNPHSAPEEFEEALGLCVEQMLKDKDIVGYLEQ